MTENDPRLNRWLKIIESGILTSYPQRIQASFNYLDSEGNGFFTIKVRMYHILNKYKLLIATCFY